MPRPRKNGAAPKPKGSEPKGSESEAPKQEAPRQPEAAGQAAASPDAPVVVRIYCDFRTEDKTLYRAGLVRMSAAHARELGVTPVSDTNA